MSAHIGQTATTDNAAGMRRWTLRSIAIAAVALLALWALAVPRSFLPVARADCTIPAAQVQVTVLNQSGTNSPTNAWDWFDVGVQLTDLDGMAQGCTATVQLPSIFGGMQATTLYLNADGGYTTTPQADTVATMSIDPDTRTMTFVLTDYAATHQDVSVFGTATAQIDSTIERGVTTPITLLVNGTTTPGGDVTGGTCDTDCPGPPDGYASKWGTANSDGSGDVTIVSPVAPTSGTVITITDILNSADQSIDGVLWAAGYNCTNTWGDPGVTQPGGSCDTSQDFPVTVSGTNGTYQITTTVPNEFVRLKLAMTFEGAGPWRDTARVEIDGTPYETTTVVKSYSAGGGGTGTESPTPTPTPTETPTETPTPTPTPTETPTETPTPTPTPTETPSETPTPTPTPTETPSVTPTPTLTASETPGPRLAFTGASGLTTFALIGGALVLGGLLLLAPRASAKRRH